VPHVRRTPERLSAFSDGVFAVLITVLVLELRPPELPTLQALLSLWPTWLSYAVKLSLHRHRLGQSPPSHALCRRGHASADLVQFRASVFRVAASAFHRMDGREQAGAAAGGVLCRGVLPRQRDLHIADLGAHRADPVKQVSAKARKVMRFRSIAKLGIFAAAALVCAEISLVGLGMCCCCLILYLRPEAPGAET